MEDAINVKLYNWTIGAIASVLSFLFGWKLRDTARINKLEQLAAQNSERDANQERAIQEIKKFIDSQNRAIESIKKCVQEQKEMFNEVVRLNQKMERHLKK
jgi:hypothetical protein